jgi:hypothetical protein
VVGYLVVGGSGVWSAGTCAASLALASVTEIDESLHEFLRQGDVNVFWVVVGLQVVVQARSRSLAT